MSVTDPITPEPLLQLGLGFMASKTLLSAVELGIFTALAEPEPSSSFPPSARCSRSSSPPTA